MEYTADEVGVLKMDMVPTKQLSTGEVGYIISGIKKCNGGKRSVILLLTLMLLANMLSRDSKK